MDPYGNDPGLHSNRQDCAEDKKRIAPCDLTRKKIIVELHGYDRKPNTVMITDGSRSARFLLGSWLTKIHEYRSDLELLAQIEFQ